MLSRLFGRRDAGLGAAADQMIAFFKLEHLAGELAGGLSYGQQKLLDAAMAFMAGPRLVLLDEPAGGVNLTMLANLKDRLKAFAQRAPALFIANALRDADMRFLRQIHQQPPGDAYLSR